MDEVTEDGQHRASQQDCDERSEGIAEGRLHAEGGEEIERGIHAKHHEIALGEIDDAHHAEDQPEPDAHQAVDRTDQEAGGQRLQEAFQRLGHWRPRAGRAYPCFGPAVDMASSAVSGLNIALPIFGLSLSIMMPAAVVTLSLESGNRRP